MPYPGGNIVRITPTISTSAYSSADVLFLTTEIPNAVSSRGGVSELQNITVVTQHDADDDDIGLVFMQNSYDLIGALSPGSSGGSAITDDNIQAANILGTVELDTSDNQLDLGGGRVYTSTSGSSAALNNPLLVQAAGGSTSIYVAGIARDAQTYVAIDDLDLIFHFKFLE